ncbi:MAG: hypothetical protein ACYSTS_10370 [Planctomycetota bacterium]|jgi:hypothetical protein
MDTKKSKSPKQAVSKQLSAEEMSLLRSPLEQELYGYAVESKSVLLYGKDNVNKRNLITSVIRVVKLRLSDKSFDYTRDINLPDIDDEIKGCLPPEMRKAIEDEDYKKIFELIRDTRFSSDAIGFLDCGLNDGKSVYEIMTHNLFFSESDLTNYLRFRDGKTVSCESKEQSFFSERKLITCYLARVIHASLMHSDLLPKN